MQTAELLKSPFHDSEVCFNNMRGNVCKWTNACLISHLSLTLIFQDASANNAGMLVALEETGRSNSE